MSGVRSYATQQSLYRRYRAGTLGNIAANPDRRFGPKGLDGRGIWRGSWHMQQADGYGHAVDLRITGKITTQEVNRIATSFGLRPTVASEWWHHQWRSASADEFPAPALDNAPSEAVEAPAMDWAGIIAAVENQKRQVARVPLKRGSRGDAVRTLQLMLGHQGFDPGTPTVSTDARRCEPSRLSRSPASLASTRTASRGRKHSMHFSVRRTT